MKGRTLGSVSFSAPSECVVYCNNACGSHSPVLYTAYHKAAGKKLVFALLF